MFFRGMTSFTFGSFESVSEAKCEYEDADLIWRNTPAYSDIDVMALSWYKGNATIATWEKTRGFEERPPYIGRLKRIGTTALVLKIASRSDSGSYGILMTLASTARKLESITRLDVIVAPSSQCKPIITEEGSVLKANLPSEGCGTPPLILKWQKTNKAVIGESNTSSLLDLGSYFERKEYIACAEGDSVRCYSGSISDLCTGFINLQQVRGDNDLTSSPVSVILPITFVTIAAILILVVIWWKRRSRKRQSEHMELTSDDTPTGIAEVYISNEEETSLIEKGETSREGTSEIQNYLRGLYKDMTSISLSPTGNEHFVDVSEVYIDLDFQQMETKNFKSKETDSNLIPSYKTSESNEDLRTTKAHNDNNSRIIIAGCNGCGKSTWCKHLLRCWSENSNNGDANMKSINLASLGEYQILLYISLKSSDRTISFQELLQRNLFQGQPEYLNMITKYMQDKHHAQSILVLIDGFDKFSGNVNVLSEFLDHELFSLCTVIFTCRPSSLKLFFSACVDSSIQLKLFKVSEFPLEKSIAYASMILRRLRQHNKNFNINNFLTFTKNVHVQDLLKVPYFCLMVLFVWMENKNPYIEITDILLCIMEYLLDTATKDQVCKENIKKLSQGNSSEVLTGVKKLDVRFVKIKNIMHELSMMTEEIFYTSKGWADKETTTHGWMSNVTPANDKYKFHIEVLHEIGLVTKSLALKSNESCSTLSYTNDLICQFFLSLAMAFKKGHIYDYIISDLEVALKHSMIIHMLCQFSPTLGKEIFVELRKFEGTNLETFNFSEQTSKIRYSITKLVMGDKYHQMKWLQVLMYKGDLDDEKLLFLTNALRSTGSLTSIMLENNENINDLVFWFPCSQNLEKLTLNISQCTLLLCPEWNIQIPLKLKEVVIKSVIISSFDHEVLTKAFKSCKNIKKKEMSPKVVGT